MTAIEIREISSITPGLAASLAALVGQLSSSARMPTKDELEQIILSPATILLGACKSESLLGMLTLVIFRIPTGVRGIIEDVVVDEAHRGQGIAEALTSRSTCPSTSDGGEDSRSDVPPVQSGGQPVVPEARVSAAREQCVSLLICARCALIRTGALRFGRPRPQSLNQRSRQLATWPQIADVMMLMGDRPRAWLSGGRAAAE